jgi:hypothetical protein
MADTTFSNCREAVHVDRRQLLASAATMAAAGVLPNRERTESVGVAKALPAHPPQLEARNFGTVLAINSLCRCRPAELPESAAIRSNNKRTK